MGHLVKANANKSATPFVMIPFLSLHSLLAIVIASAAMHDQYVWLINGGTAQGPALTVTAPLIYVQLEGGV